MCFIMSITLLIHANAIPAQNWNCSRARAGFTKYHLTTKPDYGSAQRSDRINEILNKMIQFEHIKIVFESSSATYYHITEKGTEWYINQGKKFQEFINRLRQ